MQNGWISLHRQIREHAFFKQKRKFSKFEAWVDMLLEANHCDKDWISGNKIIPVKRGSFITSELKLMDRWQWSKSKVRAFLKLLEVEQMIVKKTDTKKTGITIVNYEVYQEQQTAKEPEKDRKKTSKRPQKDTTNNVNKVNKEINKEKDIVDVAPAPLKTAIDYYHDKFLEKFNEKPNINGSKDGALLKKVVTTYGIEKVKALLDRFFESEEKFIKDTGYTVGVFYSQVNKLITMKELEEEPLAPYHQKRRHNNDTS